MKGRSGRDLCIRAMLGILVLFGIPTAVGAQSVSGDHRLMRIDNFVRDAALVRSVWLEIRGEHADWGDGGNDTRARGLVAFSLADRFELGGSFGYLDRSRSEDQVLFGRRLSADLSNNGLDDVDLFGKFVFKGPANPWAAGLSLKLPVADDREGLGSGATDFEAFVANRHNREKWAWTWNAGVRINGDPKQPGAGSGNTSAAAGGGFLWRLSYSWIFMAEGRYETRRYDGSDVEFAVAPSLDFRPTENLALRLGVEFGLTDGSPNVNYVFGFVFHL
ncbi:MAG TPA: hypothetical protein VGR38_12115 [Candidatus Polarisedimenticolia bacterium]|nr:hypothetical protein [Candidatus Polarisedimenticolia bacterium]